MKWKKFYEKFNRVFTITEDVLDPIVYGIAGIAIGFIFGCAWFEILVLVLAILMAIINVVTFVRYLLRKSSERKQVKIKGKDNEKELIDRDIEEE